tara:strand:- start:4229 stop:4378 length:150 start_codon:yes stop_codon:yes gene_type:complete
MENDLLIPLFWTFVFGLLVTIGLRRISKKAPTDKKWVRPEPEKKSESDE